MKKFFMLSLPICLVCGALDAVIAKNDAVIVKNVDEEAVKRITDEVDERLEEIPVLNEEQKIIDAYNLGLRITGDDIKSLNISLSDLGLGGGDLLGNKKLIRRKVELKYDEIMERIKKRKEDRRRAIEAVVREAEAGVTAEEIANDLINANASAISAIREGRTFGFENFHLKKIVSSALSMLSSLAGTPTIYTIANDKPIHEVFETALQEIKRLCGEMRKLPKFSQLSIEDKQKIVEFDFKSALGKSQEVDGHLNAAMHQIGGPAHDLHKKLDMMRETYGDGIIEALTLALEKDSWTIIDVIGYALVVTDNDGYNSRPFDTDIFRSEFFNNAYIKVIEFTETTNLVGQKSKDLLYIAKNDRKVIGKLESCARHNDQKIMLPGYVIRGQRKDIAEISKGDALALFHPFLERIDAFKDDSFDRFVDKDLKFKNNDKGEPLDKPLLFQNHYQLLNDAAVIHALLGTNRDNFIAELKRAPQYIEANLNKILGNIETVKNAILPMEASDVKERIEEMLASTNDIVNAVKDLLVMYNELSNVCLCGNKDISKNEAIKKKNEGIEAAIEEFNGAFSVVQKLLVRHYLIPLKDEKNKIKIDLSYAIGTALTTGTESLFLDIVKQCSALSENILILSHVEDVKQQQPSVDEKKVKKQQPLGADIILYFINGLRISVKAFLENTNLLNDNCVVQRKGECTPEFKRWGKICANLASASAQLLGSVYRGEDISSNFDKFIGVIDSFGTPTGNHLTENSALHKLEMLAIVKTLSDKAKDLRLFFNYLSEYSKFRSELTAMKSRISTQFVTNRTSSLTSLIDKSLRKTLENYESNISDHLVTIMRKYRASDNNIKMQTLVNSYCGIMGQIYIGFPFRIGALFGRPDNGVRIIILEKKKTSVTSNNYLFCLSTPSKNSAFIKKLISAIVNNGLAGDNMVAFLNDIDSKWNDISSCLERDAYITPYQSKFEPIDGGPTGDTFVSIVPEKVEAFKEGEKFLPALYLLDAISLNNRAVLAIQTGGVKKLFVDDNEEIDLKGKLSQYIKWLDCIIDHLKAKVKKLQEDKKGKIDLIMYTYKEPLLSALLRIKAALYNIVNEKQKVANPELQLAQLKTALGLNPNIAVALLEGKSSREIADILRDSVDSSKIKILLNLQKGDRFDILEILRLLDLDEFFLTTHEDVGLGNGNNNNDFVPDDNVPPAPPLLKQ
ncbi:MAG: hypothetical protein LBT67_01315 [Holosporaceae bacterium]|nr:hypothetical protein [Holosporaceae bacterium]